MASRDDAIVRQVLRGLTQPDAYGFWQPFSTVQFAMRLKMAGGPHYETFAILSHLIDNELVRRVARGPQLFAMTVKGEDWLLGIPVAVSQRNPHAGGREVLVSALVVVGLIGGVSYVVSRLL